MTVFKHAANSEKVFFWLDLSNLGKQAPIGRKE